ncbi:MAG: phosphoribosylamine--glycine ligase [Cytophagaceae bacterium]|jgi:phosphoribosylamine--glycine ligase|nr:phosphoribosylamine--glycine ligase [Cytophagaceae bacterium]
MNILITGSGGREHALGWKIKQSALTDRLFFAPGNAGTAAIGVNIKINPVDFEAVKQAVLANKIDMVVVGPEEPLVMGIVDFFENDAQLQNVRIVGCTKAGARLEGSKEFAKQFMLRHNIPTARYLAVSAQNSSEGKQFMKTLESPYVLKADGLAAGKGVLIPADYNEACAELDSMLGGKFGKAGNTVVIEEFLSGIELSVFVLTDGKNYLILPEAKDYKRIGVNDTGLNTGGMGAVSPVPFADAIFMKKIEERIVKPTIEGLKKENIAYKGFLFLGLIKVAGEPFVIEYNVRMGDPETEVVMPRLKNDLVELLAAVCDGNLSAHTTATDSRTAVTVMLVSGGYPGSYAKGVAITGLDNMENSMLFHAGTDVSDNKTVTAGGRVLAITSYGDTIETARRQSLSNAEKIIFDGRYFRGDIGFDLLG